MANILVVYGGLTYPLRATTRDHLYCFKRYSGHRCFYFNITTHRKPWYRKVPKYLLGVQFDLIVFFTDTIRLQWPPRSCALLRRQAGVLKDIGAIKVALMQDEHYNAREIEAFVNGFGIRFMFSCAPESEWGKIYPTIDFNTVTCFRSFPGYLDIGTIRRIDALAKKKSARPIDIGYRAYGIRQWLGRHGFLKIWIADIFKEKAPAYGMTLDISTRLEDTFLGDKWYEFLLRCKYTIAVEGGASMIDTDGTLRRKTEEYLANHPGAPFEEIEAACFPGRDGLVRYTAISPKHLEACATRTCQILVEGEYNGVLKPRAHYIELKRDFGNIDDVLKKVKDDSLRKELVDRAYEDIVASGLYTYNNFVAMVLEKTLKESAVSPQSYWLQERMALIAELRCWAVAAIMTILIAFGKKMLPKSFFRSIKRLFGFQVHTTSRR